MGRTCKAHLDPGIIRYRNGSPGKKRRERIELQRRKIQDLHFIPKQRHGVRRNRDQPTPQPEETAVVDDDRDLPVGLAYHGFDVTENRPAFERLQHTSMNQLTDPHRLRIASCSEERQIRSGRNRRLRQGGAARKAQCNRQPSQ